MAWSLSRASGRSAAAAPSLRWTDGDEGAETAALREFNEETTLTARIGRLLWTGTPVSSGSEAEAHGPEDSFELMWAGADEFDDLGLYPADVRLPLAELLSTSA
jgi:8-oxo-dGTP pyrophosphatase MutT (NUDIX family)